MDRANDCQKVTRTTRQRDRNTERQRDRHIILTGTQQCFSEPSVGITYLKSYHLLFGTILYCLVNTKTTMLVLDRIHDFIIGMTIPYLTPWTYAQMGVCFC